MEYPPYAYVPGGPHPHPERDANGHRHSATTFGEGVDLYHAGFFWEAHEVWEGLWRAVDDVGERDFYQGLIQLAAALLQVQVGHQRGAEKLRAAAREKLARAGAMHGLDPGGVVLAMDRSWPAGPRLVREEEGGAEQDQGDR